MFHRCYSSAHEQEAQKKPLHLIAAVEGKQIITVVKSDFVQIRTSNLT